MFHNAGLKKYLRKKKILVICSDSKVLHLFYQWTPSMEACQEEHLVDETRPVPWESTCKEREQTQPHSKKGNSYTSYLYNLPVV